MRVLITGSTGFIGQECWSILSENQNIKLFSSSAQLNQSRYNLLEHNDIIKLISHYKPTHILHLAWYTGQGYANDIQNLQWLEASKILIDTFIKNGGKRFVGVGTCFEYDLNNTPLTEQSIKNIHNAKPHTLYGQAKLELSNYLETLNNKGHFSWAWCRPFYVYGAGESADKLLPSAATAFSHGQDYVTPAYYRTMDYIHVQDVAKLLVKVLFSAYCGKINLGTGKGVMVKDLLNMLAKKFPLNVKPVPSDKLQDIKPIIADIELLQSTFGPLVFRHIDETLNDYYRIYKNE